MDKIREEALALLRTEFADAVMEDPKLGRFKRGKNKRSQGDNRVGNTVSFRDEGKRVLYTVSISCTASNLDDPKADPMISVKAEAELAKLQAAVDTFVKSIHENI